MFLIVLAAKKGAFSGACLSLFASKQGPFAKGKVRIKRVFSGKK